jgi:hypothetical protein
MKKNQCYINFIKIQDPADLEEQEVFDNSTESANNTSNINSPKSEPNQSVNSKATPSRSLTSKTSTSSLGKQLTSNDSFESTKNQRLLMKKTSVACINDFEMMNKKSIEKSLYEYANELTKSYRIKKLFEMFSNLNFINLNKWLQACQ